jgi:hypothetical protein
MSESIQERLCQVASPVTGLLGTGFRAVCEVVQFRIGSVAAPVTGRILGTRIRASTILLTHGWLIGGGLVGCLLVGLDLEEPRRERESVSRGHRRGSSVKGILGTEMMHRIYNAQDQVGIQGECY